jgi:catalase
MKVRMHAKKFKEHKNQAELFYNSMSENEKMHMKDALAFELDHCDDPVVYKRLCERLCEIDLELAQTVAEMVGADVPTEQTRPKHNKKAKGLSQMEYMPSTPTIATRMVAILIADGYDKVAYNGIKAALTAAGALPFTISPRRNKIFADGEDSSSSGAGVVADHHLEGQRSTMYDSVFVPGGAKSIETLRKNGRAVHWVREAFGHLKAIGATGEGVSFVKQAVELPGMEFSTSGDVVNSYGVVTAAKVEANGFKEAVSMAKEAKDFLSNYLFAISQHKNFERETAGLNQMVAY